METATSVHGAPIRLTNERWDHIVRNKPYLRPYRDEVLDTVSLPDEVQRGYRGAHVAIRSIRKGMHLHVIYRETMDTNDGFIITAYIAEKKQSWETIWPSRG